MICDDLKVETYLLARPHMPLEQTVTNLVENVNDASRKKQSINSAPSMCCEEKKEHFSPSSEHRHVSSHRVAY